MNDLRSVVLGCGSYLPAKVLTNADLSRIVDTTDEWITQRTGIRKRHIAADGELTSDLATEAARAALAWLDANLATKRAVCIIDPANLPSIAVAHKCGFQEIARSTYKGHPTIIFERLGG